MSSQFVFTCARCQREAHSQWRVLQETHAALMNRKQLLGSRLVPVYEDGLYETRSAEEMRQAEEPTRRGLALHE